MKIVHEQRCFPRSTGLPLKIYKPHVMQETKLVDSRAPLEIMEIYALLKFFWAFKVSINSVGTIARIFPRGHLVGWGATTIIKTIRSLCERTDSP